MYRLTAVAAMAAAASAAVLSLVDTDVPVPTVVPSAVSTVVPDNCSTRHVCADYINECGMWYGGCFPDCRPWPTFTAPPCPSNGTSTTTSTTTSSSAPAPVTPTPTRRPCRRPPSSSSASSLSSSEPCGGDVECVTSHLKCYNPPSTITWGGCYPACSPRPMYTPPPCPVATITSSSSSQACSAPSSSSSSLPCGGDTACVTSYRDCSTTKIPFGGCYPACSPRPLYTPPPCPQAATTTSSSSSSPELCGGQELCVASTRDCETTRITFGGCWPACSPKPFYTPPPCPEATPSASASSSSWRPYALEPQITRIGPPRTTTPPPVSTLVPPATPSTSSSELPCGGSTTCSTFYRTCPATTITFGGCQPACYPQTFYSPPPCPESTSFSSTSTSSCA